MTSPPAQSPLDYENVRSRVGTAIDQFLDERSNQLAAISYELDPVTDSLRSFMNSGKRIRPIFCWWAWRGCGGEDSAPPLIAASSLEFIQSCALIHDDMMDKSDTRRGLPAVHRQFEKLHSDNSWHGAANSFGEAAAILLGDLALTWADQMYYESGLDLAAMQRGKPIYDSMRTEVVAGQYLDVLQQAKRSHNRDDILRVAQYKTAKYTIERPLHLGASWASATPETLTALSNYGLPLGVAFQVRDDIMGVFGNPEQTGKPAGDDLREGKYTFLIDYAYIDADETSKIALDNTLGNPDLTIGDIDRVRQIIVDTGALETAERFIGTMLEEALTALNQAGLDPAATKVLQELAQAAAHRAD